MTLLLVIFLFSPFIRAGQSSSFVWKLCTAEEKENVKAWNIGPAIHVVVLFFCRQMFAQKLQALLCVQRRPPCARGSGVEPSTRNTHFSQRFATIVIILIITIAIATITTTTTIF